jgi:hypothetical protein
VSVHVRGVKCGGRVAGKSVLIVCWCMSFEVVHGVGAGRRTFRGRSSPSDVELGRICGLAGQGLRRARVGCSGGVRPSRSCACRRVLASWNGWPFEAIERVVSVGMAVRVEKGNGGGEKG